IIGPELTIARGRTWLMRPEKSCVGNSDIDGWHGPLEELMQFFPLRKFILVLIKTVLVLSETVLVLSEAVLVLIKTVLVLESDPWKVPTGVDHAVKPGRSSDSNWFNVDRPSTSTSTSTSTRSWAIVSRTHVVVFVSKCVVSFLIAAFSVPSDTPSCVKSICF
ncbi:MAG: hypothetical protein AAFP90_16420, partial [Planctomycetota bacterium]